FRSGRAGVGRIPLVSLSLPPPPELLAQQLRSPGPERVAKLVCILVTAHRCYGASNEILHARGTRRRTVGRYRISENVHAPRFDPRWRVPLPGVILGDGAH